MYARQYYKAKAGGIRYVYDWISSFEVMSIITDIDKGVVIDQGKRKLTLVSINAGAYIFSPAVVVFTNASKNISISKKRPQHRCILF